MQPALEKQICVVSSGLHSNGTLTRRSLIIRLLTITDYEEREQAKQIVAVYTVCTGCVSDSSAYQF